MASTLSLRSTKNGLTITNSLFIKAFVPSPDKAVVVDSGFNHTPQWLGLTRVWGLLIDPVRIAAGEPLDQFPPLPKIWDGIRYIDTRQWYLDAYGDEVENVYPFWHQSLSPVLLSPYVAGQPSPPSTATLSIDPGAVMELACFRYYDDPDTVTVTLSNGQVMQQQKPPVYIRWAGPADINMDGRVNQSDIDAYDANPYDFNGDGAVDEADRNDLLLAKANYDAAIKRGWDILDLFDANVPTSNFGSPPNAPSDLQALLV